MFETAAMIVAGYAGYAGWPWWSAVILGVCAGVWSTATRFSQVWRHRLENLPEDRTQKIVIYVGLWSGACGAVICTSIYFLVYWLSN